LIQGLYLGCYFQLDDYFMAFLSYCTCLGTKAGKQQEVSNQKVKVWQPKWNGHFYPLTSMIRITSQSNSSLS
jgi:hypothetical protein